MKDSHRISTIERNYPDQWVLVEVTRGSRTHQALSGRVLAHAAQEHDITLATKKAGKERPDAHLFAFYTGDRIPKGMIVIRAGGWLLDRPPKRTLAGI